MATEGVAARTTATKSVIVKSVSCPTAEITGSFDLATARANVSSLKAQRSSNDPPPLPMISTSKPISWARSLSHSTPFTSDDEAVGPCTIDGNNINLIPGNRLLRTFNMSWMTAPFGDVTTPIALGKKGNFLFRLASKRPSVTSFLRSCS